MSTTQEAVHSKSEIKRIGIQAGNGLATSSVEMPAKLKVRRHIKTMRDGEEFTSRKLAVLLEVKDKAVSNEITGMVQFGALTQHKGQGNKHITYTIVANNVSAFYLKFKAGALGKASVNALDLDINKPSGPSEAVVAGSSASIAKHALTHKIRELRSQVKALQDNVNSLEIARNLL